MNFFVLLRYTISFLHLADVEDVAAPVHGVVSSPVLRRHVGAVLGEHLAGLRHLETGVARPALGTAVKTMICV